MIIYFTGTGNSRYVAESIAKQTNDEIINANDYIKKGKRAVFRSQTPFVFVCPTYAWRIPGVFSDFIESGSFAGSNDAYFIMTCGTDIGNAEIYLKKLCDKIHMQFNGVAKVLMPENYIAMYPVPTESEIEQIIKEADKSIPKVSKVIMERKVLYKERIGIIANLKSRIVNPVFCSAFVSCKKFNSTDKCIGCAKCAELCPLNNIELLNGKPVYGNKCTHCMACICACPVEAIEYGKKTVGQQRYYNTNSPK